MVGMVGSCTAASNPGTPLHARRARVPAGSQSTYTPHPRPRRSQRGCCMTSPAPSGTAHTSMSLARQPKTLYSALAPIVFALRPPGCPRRIDHRSHGIDTNQGFCASLLANIVPKLQSVFPLTMAANPSLDDACRSAAAIPSILLHSCCNDPLLFLTVSVSIMRAPD